MKMSHPATRFRLCAHSVLLLALATAWAGCGSSSEQGGADAGGQTDSAAGGQHDSATGGGDDAVSPSTEGGNGRDADSTDAAAVDADGDASTEASGNARCAPLFASCSTDTQCCSPYRCLNVTGTLACQLEGPSVDAAPTDAASSDAGSCAARFVASLDKSCAMDSDCTTVNHNDCCGTVVTGIHVGSQATFQNAERGFLACEVGCGARGCFHANWAESGPTSTLASMIVVYCDAGACMTHAQ